ncbi:hypothetical protein H7F15_00680 [Pontibacter sp. Tf4]|uniref:OmpP1/FadL family transporter n=1 Tax=Pontibacter sp. Tf4 TaxID=2761620 RepID=UPI0016254DAA|nr:hypothetical protein [Pontibacter sp. Tf4]MBB6609539.1 hypothetical protein [Pontibacter sp. Tf4]
MYKTLRGLVCAAVLCLGYGAQAQNIGNAPYSRYGIGEYNYNTGNIRNAGMANTGVGAGNIFQINTANPALLYYNSTTVFELGVAGEVKKLQNATQSQTDGTANLSAVSLAIPIMSQRWTTALSLRPYSNVSYDVISRNRISEDIVITEQYTGDGGISELSFGHGIRLTKGLTIGGSASYLFGNITKESISTILDSTITDSRTLEVEQVVRSQETKYNALLFKAGANYRSKVTDKLFFSAGAVYTHKTDLDADRYASFERRTPLSVQDSLFAVSTTGKVNLPSSFAAGISIDNGSNFTLAADYLTQKWSDFKDLNNEQKLVDSYRASVGAEFTPDANSVGNYFERVTYRGGLYYGNTPYQVGGEQLNDKGVTFGATFPFGRSTIYDMYQLNTSFGYGMRGTKDNGRVQENYFQFNIGVTVNSRWFIKRRIE